jgi:hypothetical protein
MKSPALPNLVHCMILMTLLLTTAGCEWLPKRHRNRAGAAHPVAAPTPAATLPPGSTPPPMAARDKKFLNAASRIFAYERRLGALARQYGNSDDAQNLGNVMETEMALAGENLKALAVSKQQPIDAGAGGRPGGLEQLATQRGGDFDRKFYEEVKLSGPEGYGEFDRAFREVTDGEVKDFAKNWYPVLRNYPREAIKLEIQLSKKRK